MDDETWLLDMTSWNNQYRLPARLEDVAGFYDEELAAGSVGSVVSIDNAGRLSFHGSKDLCTGNGNLVPHGDGKLNVFDVTVTIAGCDYPYTLLNGSYQGLATLSTSDAWAYDS